MDGEGFLWTKVNITVDDGTQFLLLERGEHKRFTASASPCC